MHEIFIQLTYKNLIVIDIILNEKSFQSVWSIHMNANTKKQMTYTRFLFFITTLEKEILNTKMKNLQYHQIKQDFPLSIKQILSY